MRVKNQSTDPSTPYLIENFRSGILIVDHNGGGQEFPIEFYDDFGEGLYTMTVKGAGNITAELFISLVNVDDFIEFFTEIKKQLTKFEDDYSTFLEDIDD